MQAVKSIVIPYKGIQKDTKLLADRPEIHDLALSQIPHIFSLHTCLLQLLISFMLDRDFFNIKNSPLCMGHKATEFFSPYH